MNSRLIASNLREALSCYALSDPQGFVEEWPGLCLISSGVRYPSFNSALLTVPVRGWRELKELIEAARSHFATLRLPWSFWLCEDMLDASGRKESATLLSRAGMRLVAEYHGMETEELKPPGHDLPQFEIRRVETPATRRAFFELMSEIFELPEDVSRAIYGGERYWSSHMIAWVGYVNGKPVCSAATATAAGAIGVYSVGTIPALRRRGFAEAITRHALERARQSSAVRRTILQSTSLGLGLYRRMGFEPITRVSVYIRDQH
jgi:ribosomal protein S18 acetylase RimI-like enzyme